MAGEIYDQFGGLVRRVHVEADGTFHLSSEQQLDNIVAANKRLRENQTGKEHFRLAARVPVHVCEKAMREGWFHDDDAWKKWMNDGENRDHRVYEGRI